MKYFYLTSIIFLFNLSVFAQVGIGTTTPDPSAVLELKSTDKGLLPPRLTESERNGISSPAEGLIIYNTTVDLIEFYDSAQWVALPQTCALKVEYKSSDFSITDSQTETLFIVSDTAEVTLPALSSVNDGFRVYIKRTGLLSVSVSAATGDTIEGNLTVAIGVQFGTLEIVATSSQWVLLNSPL